MANSSCGAHSSNEYTASIEHDFSTGSISPQISIRAGTTSNPVPTSTAQSLDFDTKASDPYSPCPPMPESIDSPNSRVTELHPFQPDVAQTPFLQKPPAQKRSPDSKIKAQIPSDCLKWSHLMDKYQELSTEIDYTEDMEAKFELQLATIRARKNLLKEVQQETESMLTEGQISQQNNSTVPSNPTSRSTTLPVGSRSTLSSPGLSTRSRSSTMSTLPPGFEGSSIPLEPKAAPVTTATAMRDINPLEFLGPNTTNFYFPNMPTMFLGASAFQEGQLITVSSDSSESLDDATALEELTTVFGVPKPSSKILHNCVDDVEDDDCFENSPAPYDDSEGPEKLMQSATSDASALMDRFLKYSENRRKVDSTDCENLETYIAEMEISNIQAAGDEDQSMVAPSVETCLGENTAVPLHSQLHHSRMVTKPLETRESNGISRPGDTDTAIASGAESDSDVESLKSEIYVLRTKVQRLVNFTPEHANKKAYRSKISEVQNQLKCLEAMISKTGNMPLEPEQTNRIVRETDKIDIPDSCTPQSQLRAPSSDYPSNETELNKRNENQNMHDQRKDRNSISKQSLDHHDSPRLDRSSTKMGDSPIDKISPDRKFSASGTSNNAPSVMRRGVIDREAPEGSAVTSSNVNNNINNIKRSNNSSSAANNCSSNVLRKERHNYTKMVLEYIHKMRQLNMQLLKDKINRKHYHHYYNSHWKKSSLNSSSGSGAGGGAGGVDQMTSSSGAGNQQQFIEEEDLLLLTEELDLHQQKVMELEQRLGNWHLWLLECNTDPATVTASSSDEGASDNWISRWDAMKAELDMLAVESDNTCTLVRIALTRHARLRATLQQKGASITASSGSERRRKPNNSSATRGSHHKRRGNNYQNSNSALAANVASESSVAAKSENITSATPVSQSQNVWVERTENASQNATISSATDSKEVWQRTNAGDESSSKSQKEPRSHAKIIRQSSTESEITKITGRREESDSNSFSHDDPQARRVARTRNSNSDQQDIMALSKSNTINTTSNKSLQATKVDEKAALANMDKSSSSFVSGGVGGDPRFQHHTFSYIPSHQMNHQYYLVSPQHHFMAQGYPQPVAIPIQRVAYVDTPQILGEGTTMRGRSMTFSGATPKVKDQPQGLIVLERAKSVEASERKRFNRGQSQDDHACMDTSDRNSNRISKSRRSRSTISLPAQPAQLHETSFTDMSPKTINLLDSSVVHTPSNRGAPYGMPASDSKESLLSANPRFHNPLSPFSKKKSMPEADPRATPIFLDGGNIFSTKTGGVYRIKQPVNDLEGNDRRREHRRVQLDNSGYGGYSTDNDGPGTKSDSELITNKETTAVAAINAIPFSHNVPMQYHHMNNIALLQQGLQPKDKKKKGLTGAGHAFKNKIQKFTKELEAHLLPELNDVPRLAAGTNMLQSNQYPQGFHPMNQTLAEFYDSRRLIQSSNEPLTPNETAAILYHGGNPGALSATMQRPISYHTQVNVVPTGQVQTQPGQQQFGQTSVMAPPQAGAQVMQIVQNPMSGSSVPLNAVDVCTSPNSVTSPGEALSPSSSLSNNNKMESQFSPRHSGGSSLGSIAANSAGPNNHMGSKICATPCYYRTMPGNKIQVIYPNSNRIFQYTYSRTLPPPNKKSSTQIIQQVQPDGTLSEEKLYFFDPIQLTETDAGGQMPSTVSAHQLASDRHPVNLERSRSDGSSLNSTAMQHLSPQQQHALMMMGATGAEFYNPHQYSMMQGGDDSGWLTRKKHTMKGLVKLTKELIK